MKLEPFVIIRENGDLLRLTTEDVEIVSGEDDDGYFDVEIIATGEIVRLKMTGRIH